MTRFSHIGAAFLGAATVLCLSAAFPQGPEKVRRNETRNLMETRLLELEQEIIAGKQERAPDYRDILRGFVGRSFRMFDSCGLTYWNLHDDGDSTLTMVGRDFVRVSVSNGHRYYPLNCVVVDVVAAK